MGAPQRHSGSVSSSSYHQAGRTGDGLAMAVLTVSTPHSRRRAGHPGFGRRRSSTARPPRARRCPLHSPGTGKWSRGSSLRRRERRRARALRPGPSRGRGWPARCPDPLRRCRERTGRDIPSLQSGHSTYWRDRMSKCWCPHSEHLMRLLSAVVMVIRTPARCRWQRRPRRRPRSCSPGRRWPPGAP
jgi:hypothetical protein